VASLCAVSLLSYRLITDFLDFLVVAAQRAYLADYSLSNYYHVSI
jgi:hypothetical protein